MPSHTCGQDLRWFSLESDGNRCLLSPVQFLLAIHWITRKTTSNKRMASSAHCWHNWKTSTMLMTWAALLSHNLRQLTMSVFQASVLLLTMNFVITFCGSTRLSPRASTATLAMFCWNSGSSKTVVSGRNKRLGNVFLANGSGTRTKCLERVQKREGGFPGGLRLPNREEKRLFDF